MENQESRISDIKKPVYKKKRVFIPVIAVSIILALGLWLFYSSSTYVSTDDAFVEGHNIKICPKVTGNISKVFIEDNSKVKKGQLLVEIDPKDYRTKYDQAEAKLEAAIEKQKSAEINVNLTSITSDAALEQAKSGVDSAEASLVMAEKQVLQSNAVLKQIINEVEAQKADLELAESDFPRYLNLFKKNIISNQDYDRAIANLKTVRAKYKASLEKEAGAQAALENANAARQLAQKNLEIAQDKYKSANTVPQTVSISNIQQKISQAEIKQLKAASKQAELELSYTKIYAPQDGTISGKYIEAGSYVQTGQPLFSIIPDKLWVVANYKETQLSRIKKGQQVSIKIDAYPYKHFKGHVDSVQPNTGAKSSLFPPENAVGSFVKVVQRVPVKILFDEKPDPAYLIFPGMSAIPEIKVK